MPDSGLQKRILEAGVVPEGAVKQMEQWQSVPEGSASQVGDADLKKVRALRGDLELRGLPSIREAIPDIRKLMDRARPVTLDHMTMMLQDVEAGMDRLDRYIFEIPQDRELYVKLSNLLRPMTKLHDGSRESPDSERHITSVSLLYKDTTPSHWFCETEARGKTTMIKGH